MLATRILPRAASVGLCALAALGLAPALSVGSASAATPTYMVSPTVIPVGVAPLGAIVTPSGSELLVANNNGQSISVISAATNAVTSTVNLSGGSYPVNLIIGPDSTHAWFTDAGRDAFSSLDLGTNAVTDYGTVGKPAEVTITPDGLTALTPDYQNSHFLEFTTLATDSVTQLSVGPNDSDPEAVDLSADGSTAYVTNAGSGTVAVVDVGTKSVTHTITIGGSPYGIALSHDGSKAYVTDQNGDTVSVIDTATNAVVDTITVGANPAHITISPDGMTAIVANRGTDTVSVIDLTTDTVTQTLFVGNGPWDAAWAPNGKTIYVTNTTDATVSIVTVDDPTVPTPALPTTGIDPLLGALAASILLTSGVAIALTRYRRRVLAT